MAGTVGVNFSIGAQLSRTVTSAFSTVSSRVRGLKTDLGNLNKQNKAVTRMQSVADKLRTAQAKYAANSSAEMRAAVRTAAIAFKNARRDVKEYGLAVDSAGHAQEQLAQRIQRTQAALSRQQRLQANQAKRGELQGQVLGTIGAAMTVAAPIKLAIDYESTFADLKKVANFASAEQEKQVQQDIFAASRRSGISANGMTAIAASAAESGAVNDAHGNLDPAKLKQFLNDAAEMAVAYGISAEEAGKRLAIFQSRMSEDGMSLTAAQTRELGDAMNYLASKTNATAAATSQVVSRMGAVGSTAGLSVKSIAGLAGALVSTSESPEVAGTAMKQFLLALAQGDAMSKTQKEAFAKIGISNVESLAEGMKKGGPEAENTIMTVFEAMRKMPEAMQAGIAKDIFGLESFASIAPLVNNPKKLQEAFRLANSKEAVGSQLREFETRSNTTAGAIDRLKTSTGILGITVGSVLLPPLATAANTAVAVVKPITALADRFPLVTKVVMMTAIALVALKVGALGGMYAATMLSDGWMIARSALGMVIPGMATATTMTQALSVGTKVLGVAMRFAFGPVGLAISAVALGFGWLWENCETFRTAVTGLWEDLKSVPALIAEGFTEAIGNMTQAVGDFFESIPGFSTVKKHLGSAVTGLGKMVGLDGEEQTTAESPPTTTGTPPTTPAAPPLSTAAPKEWNHSEAMSGMSPEATAAAFPGMATSGGAGATASNFNLSFNLSGMPDGDFGKRTMDALKRRQSELEALIASIVDEQRRLAYD